MTLEGTRTRPRDASYKNHEAEERHWGKQSHAQYAIIEYV